MNPEFIKRQTAFLLQIVFFTIIVFGVHSYILHYFASDKTFFFPLWHIYVFQIVITFLLYGFLNYRMTKDSTQVFNFFMIGTLGKMILAVLFLLPLLLEKELEKKPDVFNFFIAYFLFLFFEVFSLTKMLKKPS